MRQEAAAGRAPLANHLGAHAIAVALSIAILAVVMRLWRADMAIPFDYLRAGDALHVSMLVKSLIDNPWYLRNTFVGAPHGLQHYDFPLADTLHLVLMKLLALGTGNYAIALNVYYLLTFPLIATSALAAFRGCGLSYPPALVGALLFAFLPYHFWRGEAHLFLASYYLIPPVVLVCLWLFQGDPLFRPRDPARSASWHHLTPKGLASVAICGLTAATGVYYTFFAAFFLAVSGAAGWWRRRTARQAAACAVLLATLSLSFLAQVSPTLLFTLRHGRNPMVASRLPGEAEISGLKMAQLLLPVTGHRLSLLNRLKARYRAGEVYGPNENDWSTLGAIAACGFSFLLGWIGLGHPAFPRAELFTGLSLLNLAGFLFGTTGGLGSLFALTVSPKIRAYNRISVFLAFFALLAVVGLLDSLGHRWATSAARRGAWYAGLGLLLAIGILDQSGRYAVPPYEALREAYAGDRDFIGRIEASVPRGAMIFQLPYMQFIEGPPVHRLGGYEHFRAYLHSTALRWSYGTMKGREGDAWQADVAGKPVVEMVGILALVGFSGVYVDRHGYPDAAAALEAELSHALSVAPLVSKDRRRTFFSLVAFRAHLMQAHTPAEWEHLRDAALHLRPGIGGEARFSSTGSPTGSGAGH